MNTVLTLNRFVLDYALKLAEGISEEQMDHQPAPGMHSPRWILGHLAIAYDLGASLLGGHPMTPSDWAKAFGPGSDPASCPSPPPSKQVLLNFLAAGNARLAELARGADPDKLAAPHPFKPLQQSMPTLADLVAHLMTTHATSHLGQLSAWRRLCGLPAVLGF